MEKKQRVPEGEKYWYLKGNLEVIATTDIDSYIDNSNWLERNYFHTQEEARSMLNKLRAVLKGAEVIEWPSEEEIESNADKQIHNCSPMPDDVDYKGGFWDAINYLKSKIVK